MDYYNLPEVNFTEFNVDETMEKAVSDLEKKLNKKLFPGSPERLVLITLMEQILQNRVFTNDVGKMNLLKHSRGEYLDGLGAFMDEYRIQSQRAHCTMRFTLSTPLPYVGVIPSGTRVRSGDGRQFETIEPVEIPENTTTKEVLVYASTPGIEGNGIPVGEITTLVDVFPYYQSCENITKTTGGMNTETDENFREKIHESPEKFSTAGPDGAYEYWAKWADGNIGDVRVWSPAPGEVQIVPLYRNGEIPSKEVLDKIDKVVNARDKRPLTDKVEVVAPTEVSKTFSVKYWIDEKNKINVSAIQNQVKNALNRYVLWQTSKLGRDIVPDKLIEMMISAGAKRVELTGLDFEVVAPGNVVRITDPNLSFAGLEEG